MSSDRFLTRKEVLSILGFRRVLTEEQVVCCWNKVIKERRGNYSRELESNKGTNVFYSEKSILEISKRKMWRLVFDPGFSLVQMRDILGKECGRNLRFCRENNWWLENPYVLKKRKPNYILIGLSPRFCNLKWEEQEERIDSSFYRASVSLALNTAVSFFLLRNSYFLDSFSHWGTEQDDKKTKCAVRLKKGGCIFLFNRKIDWPDPSLGVFLVKEFDKNPI